MTPLIDVTFQLIIFFMLVNNIVSAEAVQMIVPQLTEARTRELGEVDQRIVVNIVPTDYDPQARRGDAVLNTDGNAIAVVIGLDRFAPDDVLSITNVLKDYKAKYPDGLILLRADAGIRYNAVQPIMAAITGAGISKINLVAYMPDKGPEDYLGGDTP